MKATHTSFYELVGAPMPGMLSLSLDYSFDDVPDPLEINTPSFVGNGFLDKFHFEGLKGSIRGDYLPNSIGWQVVSDRIANTLNQSKNSSDIELLRFPIKALGLFPVLENYSLLGVKRNVACLDMGLSDMSFDTSGDGSEYISALHKTVIIGDKVPTDCEVFHVEEYPFFTVISQRIAKLIADLKPLGFGLRRLDIS